MEEQIDELDQKMASLVSAHQDVVERLAEVLGLGVDSAQQIIAEVGPAAAAFPSAKHLASWVGVCLERKKVQASLQPPLAKRQQADERPSESGFERDGQN